MRAAADLGGGDHGGRDAAGCQPTNRAGGDAAAGVLAPDACKRGHTGAGPPHGPRRHAVTLWRRRRTSDPERIRRALRRRCKPFLDSGERLYQVLVAEAGLSPDVGWDRSWFLLSTLRRSQHEYRLVCVTDRAIVVLQASRELKPQSVLARCSRSVRFGPMSGAWAPTDALGGRLYIHKMSHEDAAAADAEIDI
jgi:hypothetical protein